MEQTLSFYYLEIQINPVNWGLFLFKNQVFLLAILANFAIISVC